MFSIPNSMRPLLSIGRKALTSTQSAGFKNFEPQPKLRYVERPEKAKLKPMDKIPQYPAGMRIFKMQKRLRYMRGPEPLHTMFLHQQYGIIALGGGRLKHGHFEMMRMTIAKKLSRTFFAVWRVDPPWQPVTKKGQGMRMGGGKGAIDHYVTPIKADRVILEVGGRGEFFEVKSLLEELAHKLPFKAMATTHEELEAKKIKEAEMEENNANPFTMKYIIQNNMDGCHRWISPFDKKWFSKYR